MKINSYLPSACLASYVSKYIIIESEQFNANHILPDTSLVMTFRLKGNVTSVRSNAIDTLPRLGISGIRKSDRTINYMANSSNALVIFTAAGASAFIQEPLNELFEAMLPLDSLTGFRQLSRIENDLGEATNHDAVIKVIENFLLSKLIAPKTDALVSKAISEISRHSGNVRIKTLTDDLCISQDPFEKRFRSAVGVSPKQFSYISRLKAVISTVRSRKYQDLGEVVFNAGYFDLPHFHKDFKRFTGQTPAQFFQAPAYW